MLQIRHQQRHPITILDMFVLDWQLAIRVRLSYNLIDTYLFKYCSLLFQAVESCVAYVTVVVQFNLYAGDSST